MVLRLLLVSLVALLLGGCSGWVAETRLIPPTERDLVDLSGTYLADENQVVIMPSAQSLFLISDPKGREPAVEAAFDLLRQENMAGQYPWESPKEEVSDVNGPRLDRTYIMELPWKTDEGKTVYFYTIVRITGGSEGVAGSFQQFDVRCSNAAATFAGNRNEKFCIFDDYASLRSAALDALAWQDDARMEVGTTEFMRVDETG